MKARGRFGNGTVPAVRRASSDLPERRRRMRWSVRLNRALSALSGGQYVPEVSMALVRRRLEETAAQYAALERRMDERAEAVEARLAEIGRDVARVAELYRRHIDWYASFGEFEMQRRAKALLDLLRPMRVVGFEKRRYGSTNDGGYVCVDDLAGIDTILSIGVEQNAEWDLAIAEQGPAVHQFDHSIERAPAEHPRVTWHRRKIVPMPDGDGTQTVAGLVARHDRGGARLNMMMKIDIEHDEWPVLDATPGATLARFSQIVGEFHGFDFVTDQTLMPQMHRVLEKLREDFALVHVHANNHCGIANTAGLMIPFVLELTFANRHVYEIAETSELFPGPLDAPCDPGRPDILLGAFKF